MKKLVALLLALVLVLGLVACGAPATNDGAGDTTGAAAGDTTGEVAEKSDVKVGFIHVPRMTGMGDPSLPLETIRDALAAAIRAC